MNKVLKVAIFLPDLRMGGTERMRVNLAREFNRNNILVDFVLVQAKGQLIEEASQYGNIIDLKASRLLRSIPALIKYIRTEKPDRILSAMDITNCIAIFASEVTNTPILISVHSHTSTSISNLPNLRGRILIKPLMKFFYKRADHIIAVSKGVAKDLNQLLGYKENRIKVIYNPVVSLFLLESTKEKITWPWKDKDDKVIISVGTLKKAKGFDTLIKAFYLAQKTFNLKLIILGEGELRSQLEGLINNLGVQKKVYLPGFVINPYKYIKNSDLFVLSSRWEGLPNVLIEAMACGTAVVSTNCNSGPQEILNNGEFGELVSVNNEKMLADAILRTLEKPTDKNKLIERANYFSAARVSKQYLNLLFPNIY